MESWVSPLAFSSPPLTVLFCPARGLGCSSLGQFLSVFKEWFLEARPLTEYFLWGFFKAPNSPP